MSETALIDAVLDRHRRDGTRLVQILREDQEQLGWLSPPR
jgi:[NiFe] hydrogenase diaphorase moiety large subunit